jgi:hypothetical protein
VEITLSEFDIFVARALGQARRTANEGVVRNARINDQDDLDIDVQGACGELAVARWLGVYPSWGIEEAGEYPPWDVVSPRGWSIDVKCSRGSNLLVALWKRHKPKPDFYCAVRSKHPVYVIVGLIPGEEVFRTEYETDLGHGPTLRVPAAQMQTTGEWLRDYENADA